MFIFCSSDGKNDLNLNRCCSIFLLAYIIDQYDSYEISTFNRGTYEKYQSSNIQGRDKELAEMISDIKAFIKKLEIWEQNLIDGETRHFPVLFEKISQSPLEPHDTLMNSKRAYEKVIPARDSKSSGLAL
ncbi:unnamed protein product [Acanthoscelides obtectus]|uniref:Uncharacterized protein n=1 Tax=Acanthoscelides obtectus TaxID=200917 RepID=A0A9P0LEX7_ACAOB|nr:unnamed protein product [Acanthoscelides obtectus]CAK1650117.1 hypothetical protein AOBTE_LOCUS16609 [Acanthoscelides obtectus]